MRQAEQDRLKAEIDHYLETSTTTMAEEEYLNPVGVYGDPDFARRERELFRTVPVVIAHESKIPNPGDFVTHDQSGVPVLVVRQEDGGVRAFINLCRHRGAKLALEDEGCARRFTCIYHAWSFKPDGSLAGIPNDDGFRGVDRSAYGLTELPCEVRHGMVWVVLTPGASIDVAAHLGAELDDELTSFGLAGYQVERETEIAEQANWKLLVDGFLETYHLRFLHSDTVGPFIRSNCGPFKQFGLHGRMVIVRSRYDREKSTGDRFLRDIGAVYQIFPNTVLVWQSTHFERWAMFPDGDDPGRCKGYTSILAPQGQESDTRLWDTNWKILLDTVQQEDWPVARATQAGLFAGAQDTFVFGRNEPGLQHFHKTVQRLADETPVAISAR